MHSSNSRSSSQALRDSSSDGPKSVPLRRSERGGGHAGYHSAAEEDDTETLRRLLQGLTAEERERRVNAFNRFGFTPLHTATFYEQLDALQVLLSWGADPNLRADRTQWTYPLHLAALRGSAKAIKLLLDAGADPYLQDWQGFNSLNVADLASQKQVAPLLRARMEAAQETLTNGLPIQLEDNSNGYNDAWWRVRNVHWQQEEGSVRTDKDTTNDASSSANELIPLVVDHYSDGGTPAPVLATQYETRRQWCPRRLYKVASQPLTMCERERAQSRPRSFILQ